METIDSNDSINNNADDFAVNENAGHLTTIIRCDV